MKKGIKKYVILIAVAFLLTPTAVNVAFEVRQSLQFGGEWLLVPLAMLVGLVSDSFKDFYRDFKRSMKYDKGIDR